jgi:pimeloyl-ACP methyl ester carboxylesterase
MGQSAHVFDALAPLLAGRLRVLALSPRAHGPSEAPAARYHVHDFAAELVGFLDALGIGRAAVAAHSLGGPSATKAAADHPERVSRLVYLDGVHDRHGWGKVQRANPALPPPAPHARGDAEERAWARTYVYGFWNDALEADWRARPPRDERERRLEMHAEWVDDAVRTPPRYRDLRAPALALVPRESADALFPWLDGDDALRARAEAFVRDVRGPWRQGALQRFRDDTPLARVAEVGAHHFLHLATPRPVAEEMLAFLTRAGAAR